LLRQALILGIHDLCRANFKVHKNFLYFVYLEQQLIVIFGYVEHLAPSSQRISYQDQDQDQIYILGNSVDMLSLSLVFLYMWVQKN